MPEVVVLELELDPLESELLVLEESALEVSELLVVLDEVSCASAAATSSEVATWESVSEVMTRTSSAFSVCAYGSTTMV